MWSVLKRQSTNTNTMITRYKAAIITVLHEIKERTLEVNGKVDIFSKEIEKEHYIIVKTLK